MGLLSSQGKKRQIVGRSELHPCIAARIIREERMRHRLVIHFVDNEACRFALIKRTSPTKASSWLAGHFLALEADAGSKTWVERVPSEGNPGDGPSRGCAPLIGCPFVDPIERLSPPTFEDDLFTDWSQFA